jgi:hypothetical protein
MTYGIRNLFKLMSLALLGSALSCRQAPPSEELEQYVYTEYGVDTFNSIFKRCAWATIEFPEDSEFSFCLVCPHSISVEKDSFGKNILSLEESEKIPTGKNVLLLDRNALENTYVKTKMEFYSCADSTLLRTEYGVEPLSQDPYVLAPAIANSEIRVFVKPPMPKNIP